MVLLHQQHTGQEQEQIMVIARVVDVRVHGVPMKRLVYFQSQQRGRDISIAGAGYIAPECDTIVIEGNYLLMDAPTWRDMAGYWDLSVQLTCAQAELQARLIQRWLDHGLTPKAARIRAESNDLPNARLVGQRALRADVVL